MSLLTIIGILPLISAGLIALIPTKNSELIKRSAFIATLIVAAASVFMAISFDKNSDQLQFIQKNSWISAFNINFSLGIDGNSLVLILLSTILVPIVILATWHESDNGRWSYKVFYILLLVLESLMIGVFAANDLFLFYVFSKQCLFLSIS